VLQQLLDISGNSADIIWQILVSSWQEWRVTDIRNRKCQPYGVNIMLMFQVSSSSRLCLIWVRKIYTDF